MQVHQIRPKIKNKRPKRYGRGPGSGHGKTSGRGHKGAKQRSGRLFYLGFEGGNVPFFRKIPKRGFNHAKRLVPEVVNVQTLHDSFKSNDSVNPAALFAHNLVTRKEAVVKILGKGTLKKTLNVTAHRFSRKAKEKIEKAGGKVKYL